MIIDPLENYAKEGQKKSKGELEQQQQIAPRLAKNVKENKITILGKRDAPEKLDRPHVNTMHLELSKVKKTNTFSYDPSFKMSNESKLQLTHVEPESNWKYLKDLVSSELPSPRKLS